MTDKDIENMSEEITESDDILELVDVNEEDISTNESVSDNNNGKKPNKKFTPGDIIRYVVIAVALAVFVFAACKLISIFVNYSKGDKEYRKVEEEVFKKNEATTPTVLLEQNVLENVEKDNGEYKFLAYDHAALKAISENAQGYLDIPAIDLTVPIVQTSNNYYYIEHAITGAYHSYGCPFIDCKQTGGIFARNPIIYGHSMKNGAMFGMLTKYLTPSFYKEKGNQYMYLYCEKGVYIYEIFSIYITNAYDDSTYVFEYENDEAYANYVLNAKSRSYFNTGVEVTGSEKIITLSTCYDDKEARLIVHAKRLE